MKKCCAICTVGTLLAVVGAINWGLVGLFQFNLVTQLVGDGTTLAKVIYGLVGVGGVVTLLGFFKLCPCQKDGACCS